ncbi:MAG: hypothetical protein RR636_12165 [Clostridium sp.]|uniref:hypothetical protein n=1 Tax=Clostridium sp. TaxID=1506 RepID=UPI0030281265
MGKKISMFSKDYRRRLKLRRIKYMAMIITFFIIAGIVVGMASSDRKFIFIRSLISREDSNVNEEINPSGEVESKEQDNIEQDKDEVKIPNVVESFDVKLQSGEGVTVKYEEIEAKRKIQAVEGAKEIKCSLSPSKEKALILEKSSQSIYLVNADETLIDITNTKYVSTTNEVFTKESVIKNNPAYKWIENAEFIDDNNIAYTSGLPWIKDTGDRYLWIVNLENNAHTGYFNIKGKNVTFGEVTSNGVLIYLDDKEIKVNKYGETIE